MRKYQYNRNSKGFANVLGRVNAFMERVECAQTTKALPLRFCLKEKARFYFTMMKLRMTLETAKFADFVSKDDAIKLKNMWWGIFKRRYKPKI